MAKVIDFRVESGISVEIKGTWYKFGCAITVQPDPDEDFADVKQKAWATCDNEIYKQVSEIMDIKK